MIASPISVVPTSFMPSDLMSAVRRPLVERAGDRLLDHVGLLPMLSE